MNALIREFLIANENDNPIHTLELLKVRIKEKSKQYSKMIANNKRNKLAKLYNDLNSCESKLAKDPQNIALQTQREKVKIQIEIIEQERINSSKFRSKQLLITHIFPNKLRFRFSH